MSSGVMVPATEVPEDVRQAILRVQRGSLILDEFWVWMSTFRGIQSLVKNSFVKDLGQERGDVTFNNCYGDVDKAGAEFVGGFWTLLELRTSDVTGTRKVLLAAASFDSLVRASRSLPGSYYPEGGLPSAKLMQACLRVWRYGIMLQALEEAKRTPTTGG